MRFQFRQHLSTIIVFAIVMLGLMMLARIINLLYFGGLDHTLNNIQFIDNLLIKGLRFDLKIASTSLFIFYWIPALLFSWFCKENNFERYLQFFLKCLLTITVLLIFVDFGFHYYYAKPIDLLIYGLFEDDTQAIFDTIFSHRFLMLLLLASAVSAYLLWIMLGKIFLLYAKVDKTETSISYSLMFTLLSFILLLTFARGSWNSFPLQRNNASVSDDSFINSLVMNSALNLYYASLDHQENSKRIFKTDILQEHKIDSLSSLISLAGYSDDFPLVARTKKNEQLETIKPHVIFVLMEGWSSQIALTQSFDNQILGEFAQHAEEDYFNTRLFCNQDETNPSIENILLNTPITPLSQSLGNKTSFSMSNVLPFKNKGYKTLFLSGGYSAWRNHNDFWLRQGFDQYVGRSKIEATYQVDASDNPWGVYDEYVFKYLEQRLLQAEENKQSLFSFVLTTNNHRPIRLPHNYQAPPLNMAAFGKEASDTDKYLSLTGYHYQTDQLGRFISWVKNSKFRDRVIIVATGDHPVRKFFDYSPIADLYQKYSVPGYFYVPDSLGGAKRILNTTAGSHADLFPTLIELSLSEANYFQFGQSLLQKSPSSPYGWFNKGIYLFGQGVALESNQLLYPFDDPEKLVLATTPQALDAVQENIMRQEKHRKWLKQYLIVNDYKERSKLN